MKIHFNSKLLFSVLSNIIVTLLVNLTVLVKAEKCLLVNGREVHRSGASFKKLIENCLFVPHFKTVKSNRFPCIVNGCKRYTLLTIKRHILRNNSWYNIM